MRPGARTPEELEALLEDAFVVRDSLAVAGLFENGAVLSCAAIPRTVHGPVAIASLAEHLWGEDRTYVADLRQVLQAGDTALVIGTGVVNVARRGPGGWRYAIALLDPFDDTTERQEP